MATTKHIGWGIIGLGTQAAILAQAITATKNARLVAVYSADAARARAFVGDTPQVLVTTSLDIFFAHSTLTTVVVASPNGLHADQAMAALRAGKHVLVEKPMTTSVTDARNLVRTAQKTQRILNVGFHLRHKKVMQEARQLILNGAIGTLRAADLQWSIGTPQQQALPPLPPHMRWREKTAQMGGGALMARGVHLFDLWRFLTGVEVQAITGIVQKKAGAEIRANALLEAGTAIVHISTSKELPFSENAIVLRGSSGVLRIDGGLDPQAVPTLSFRNEKTSWVKRFAKQDPYRREIESIETQILGKKESVAATGEDGLKTVLLTEAFYASVQKDGRVRVGTR